MAETDKDTDKTKTDAPADALNPDSVKAEPSKKGSNEVPVMRVRVSSPFKVFFDEDALSITGENATGPFDILPHHHNFISLLTDGELSIRKKDGKVTRIEISGGIMHVKADQVVVFLNV